MLVKSNKHLPMLSVVVLYFLTVFLDSVRALAHPAPGFYVNDQTPSLVYDFIDNARHSLDIETYEMTDQAFQNKLFEALARGVRVRILKDSKRQEHDEFRTNYRLRRNIQNQGGQFSYFQMSLCGMEQNNGAYCFMHGKVIIRDRTTALISTGNFNSSSICPQENRPGTCNRDYSVVIDDADSLNTLREVFERDLSGRPYRLYDLLPPSRGNRPEVTVGPHISLTKFILEARNSVRFENLSFVEEDLITTLRRVAEGGKRVDITIPSPESFGPPTLEELEELRDVLDYLDHPKISIRLFQGTGLAYDRAGRLHAKAIVIDDSTAWIGSTNGTEAALYYNREFGFRFSNPDSVMSLIEMMAINHQRSKPWRLNTFLQALE